MKTSATIFKILAKGRSLALALKHYNQIAQIFHFEFVGKVILFLKACNS